MAVDWQEIRNRTVRSLAKTDELYQLRMQCNSTEELYRNFTGGQRSAPGSFKNAVAQSKVNYENGVEAELMPKDLPSDEIISDKMRADAYKAQNTELRAKIEKRDKFYSQLNDLLTTTFVPMPAMPVPKRMKKGNADHAVIQTLTDIHIGELVKPEETGALSEYNYDVFLQRKDTFLGAFTNQLADFRRSYKVNTLYILGLGDWVTGEDVFNMQLARVDLSIGEQIITAAQEMARTILVMAEQFAHTEVILQYGNHGQERNTTNNNDITAYMMVKMLLAEQEHINVHISPSNSVSFSLGPDNPYIDFEDYDREYNYTAFHGQEANRYMGVPYYGVNRAKSRFDQMVNQVSDFMFIGHHHVDAQMWDDGWGITASWVGGTDFSIKRLQASSRPSQHFYTFSPKYGLGWNIQLYLDDEPSLPDANDVGIRGNGMTIPTLEG